MSWEQLAEVYRLDAQERADIAAQPPLACPNDGTPYQTDLDGLLYCPFDGHRPGGGY